MKKKEKKPWKKLIENRSKRQEVFKQRKGQGKLLALINKIFKDTP